MFLKKIVFFSIILASIIIINNFIHSIYSLWQKKDLVVKAKEDLVQEKQDNTTLKKKLAVANNPQFVEEEARNKLFLAKPGEGVIIMPAPDDKKPSSEAKPPDTRPNWQKWWDVFF